jgi:adenylate cyclase
MSVLNDNLNGDVSRIISANWNSRDGQVVPATDDVVLANGAVRLEVAVLYADLAHSTQLARKDRRVAAKVVRAYLATMSRLIKSNGGEVRSFDGDRVMGVFIGNQKHSNAVKCALQMKYVLTEILRPQVKAKFSSLSDFLITHGVGVSRSEVLVVRAGVRGSNDLVFIGSAPNIAAKLSEIRDSPYLTYIDHNVYKYLFDWAKLGGPNNENMWTFTTREIAGESWHLYKSSWHWTT